MDDQVTEPTIAAATAPPVDGAAAPPVDGATAPAVDGATMLMPDGVTHRPIGNVALITLSGMLIELGAIVQDLSSKIEELKAIHLGAQRRRRRGPSRKKVKTTKARKPRRKAR